MAKKVLVVDDSPIIHNLLTKALEKHGYQVCGNAKNGKEGVELYALEKPDIVFMDITMPIMDGLEAVREIRGKDDQAKIIMLSAMGDQEVMDEAKDLGVQTFLKKPFNEYKIISALSNII